MIDEAASWVRALPKETSSNIKELYREFAKRFSLTDLDRWNKASMIWSRAQGPDEKVDKYVSEIRSAARVVPITDNTVLKFAIIRGLRPDIRLHVLQSSPTTIDDVLKAARVAETAIAASQPTSEVGELRKQIASLIEKLSSQPAVAAVNTADPPRRVTFAREETTNPRPSTTTSRSPSYERSGRRQSEYDDRRVQYNEGNQQRNYSSGQGRQSYDQQRRMESQYDENQYNGQNEQGQPSDRDQRQWRGRRPSKRGGYSAQGRYGNRSPYANVTCYTCGKTGHISPQCWQNTSYPPPGPSYRR
jgi:hypothetical protein